MTDEPTTPKPRRKAKQPLFGMTDAQLQIIVNGVGFVVIAVLTAYFGANAAKEAESVRTDLKETSTKHEAKLDSIESTGEKSHSIINSGSVQNSKALAVATKALSVLTKDPADILAAEVAQKQYESNVAKQDTIDAKAFPKGAER